MPVAHAPAFPWSAEGCFNRQQLFTEDRVASNGSALISDIAWVKTSSGDCGQLVGESGEGLGARDGLASVVVVVHVVVEQDRGNRVKGLGTRSGVGTIQNIERMACEMDFIGKGWG